MDANKDNNGIMTKKAFIYTRVSSEEQVTNFSLENQKEYCEREAKRQGYDVEYIYREEGASAKNTNRPQLLRLLEDCRVYQKEVSALFIYKIDRVSRDTFDYLVIKKKLASYGIRIISVTEPVEDNPMGEFVETMMAASARLDNAQKSLRTLDGMRKRLEIGWANGKAPVGYKNITRNEKQIIIPDPVQFDLVKKAWEEMATGAYSLDTIVPYMNKLGIKINYRAKDVPITRNQQTQRIFRDKFYAGFVVSKKFGIDKLGNHEPMISEEIFYKVQAIIDGRSFTAGINYKRQHEDFPLRGQVICGECNEPMTGSWSKGRKEKYAYYFCGRGKHKSTSIPKMDFENLFLDFVRKIEPQRELIGLFSEMVKEKWETRYTHLNNKQKLVEQDLDSLYELRKRLTDGHLKGTYTDDVYKEQLATIEDEILVKKTLQSESKLEKIDIDTVVEFMNSFLWNLVKAWREGDLNQRKTLTGSIFPKNVIFENNKFRTTELGPCFKLIQQFRHNPTSLGVTDGIRTRGIRLHKPALYH